MTQRPKRKTTRSVKKHATRTIKKAMPRAAKKLSRRAPATRTGAAASQRVSVDVREIDSLRSELKRMSQPGSPSRWNANPEDVRRSVAKLVLTLIEFIRQVLERQAIRRMDAGTLTDEETEKIGLALMRLEETIRDLAAQFGLHAEDLKLDLGPVGQLV